MLNNKIIFVILIIIITLLTYNLIKNIYLDKKHIKENFFAIEDDVSKLQNNVEDINFNSDISKGQLEDIKKRSIVNKSNIETIVQKNKENNKKLIDSIQSIKDTQQKQKEELDNTKKSNRMLNNILDSDGDIPTQGRMLNDIIKSSDIERNKWSRNFYDLKQKQDSDQVKTNNILNEMLKERKDLKSLVEQSEKQILQQTNKFTEGIQKLGEFHDNYQKELESILKRKYNLSQDAFDINEKIQNSRIQKLNKELEQITFLKKKITNVEDNESRSIKCLGNGDRLNITPVEFNGNPTGKYVIFLNDGCLSFKKNGVYDSEACELSDLQQHFVIHDIKDYIDYNKFIDKVNDGTKEFVFETDDIKYPFKLVTPLEREGEALMITDEGISIEPIVNNPHQRFRTSLIPSSSNCKK